MDFTPVIALLLSLLWYLLPLLLIATVIKTPWFKGMVGEWFLNLSIRLFLDKREYRLLKNVTLLMPEGSIQTYHVLVSRFRVLIIEIKNIKRWISQNILHPTPDKLSTSNVLPSNILPPYAIKMLHYMAIFNLTSTMNVQNIISQLTHIKDKL
ncbi:NERD domain-containing protein [Aeromonas sanarellii]|nr:NERD domain-containing protein [Aeromonas sanarellii]